MAKNFCLGIEKAKQSSQITHEKLLEKLQLVPGEGKKLA